MMNTDMTFWCKKKCTSEYNSRGDEIRKSTKGFHGSKIKVDDNCAN